MRTALFARATLCCVLLGGFGCERQQVEPQGSELGRGETVVVEVRAAEFVEAQVLSSVEGKVRVQTLPDGNQLLADRGDLYRPGDHLRKPEPHAFGICSWGERQWLACQIESVTGARLVAIDLEGVSKTLNVTQVLAPSAATRMTQQRLFTQSRARGKFEARARAAGHPLRPAHWNPRLGERVLARRGHDWEAAVIEGVNDAGVTVVWSGPGRAEPRRMRDVVPEPPYLQPGEFSVGDFALKEGEQGGARWVRVRVVAVAQGEVVVVDRDGEKSRVSAKELVPLVH